MKFSLLLPTDKIDQLEEFVSAQAIADIAIRAERAGFSSINVTDHPIPDSKWLKHGGHHALDPFVALSFAAANTNTIKLHTNILVLPYRNPFLTAKAVSSLDLLSKGRTIIGIGSGYQKREFAALGVDYHQRGMVTDDALATLKQAWQSPTVTIQGIGFDATGNGTLPMPLQKPHPPLWIGGNSQRAIQRVIEYGNGWCPFPAEPQVSKAAGTASITSIKELSERIQTLKNLAEDAERIDPIDICMMPFGMDVLVTDKAINYTQLRDQIYQLREIGVTWGSVGLRAKSREEFLEQIDRFNEEIIEKT